MKRKGGAGKQPADGDTLMEDIDYKALNEQHGEAGSSEEEEI